MALLPRSIAAALAFEILLGTGEIEPIEPTAPASNVVIPISPRSSS